MGKKTSHQIASLKTKEGRITYCQKDIRVSLKDYFSELYQAKSTDNEIVESLTSSLPTLSESARLQRDKEITLEELQAARHTLPTGKASGLDGMPAELYKTFWDLLGPELHEALIDGLRLNLLPLSCRRAVLTLVPKKVTFSNRATGIRYHCFARIIKFSQRLLATGSDP